MGELASKDWASFGVEPDAPGSHAPRRGLARAGLSWIGGTLATVAAVTIAAVLTVVFAATLAVILVLASALIAVCALALRARRRRPSEGVLIEARRVGHSWVAYGWDQRPR
jgi:apolipoprotein N-acyltransferase